MLLDDNVVTDGKPKSGAFPSGFRCEERVEDLLLYLERNTRAVVANPDFHTIAKTLGRGSESWHVIAAIYFCFTLDRSIEAIGDQIQKGPRNVLRVKVNLACRWVKRPLQGNVETLFLGPR